MRSDIDGSNSVILADIAGTPSDIILDKKNGKIYWGDSAQGKIQRASLDGSDVELLDMIELHVTGIDLDVENGKMYYTVTSLDSVRRADLNGQDPEILVTGLASVGDITLDLIAGKMYFSGSGIQRADLDGSSLETIATGSCDGVALSPSTGHVYCADSFNDVIVRRNLDGSNARNIVSGLNNPRHVEVILAPLVPTTSFWGMIVLAILVMIAATIVFPGMRPGKTSRRFRNRRSQGRKGQRIIDYRQFSSVSAPG